MFQLPDGSEQAALAAAKLKLTLHPPADQVDIVPGIKHTLLSGSKMAEAGYTAVYDEDEVNFYNKTAKIVISEEAVLTWYRCKRSKLWRVALAEHVQNENTDTVIIDSPCGLQSLNWSH